VYVASIDPQDKMDDSARAVRNLEQWQRTSVSSRRCSPPSRGPAIYLLEDWLRPFLDGSALEPVLEPWWHPFTGPFLYDPSRRCLAASLRAFVDFIGERRP